MIIDKLNTFAEKSALPTATGAKLFGDVIDLGASGMHFNDGIYLIIQVTTAVESAGDATVELALASDAQPAIAVDGTATIHASTGAIVKAKLAEGERFIIALPPGQYERYLGVIATVGTAALTAGAVTAALTMTPQNWVATDDGL